MTIDDLEEFRYLSKEISAVDQRIAYLRNTYKSPAFEKIGQSPPSPGDPTAQAAYDVCDLEQEYNEKRKELADKEKRINAWLDTIHDPEIRLIIRCYYINGMNWNETSREVYRKNSYYNARKTLMRWFGKEK